MKTIKYFLLMSLTLTVCMVSICCKKTSQPIDDVLAASNSKGRINKTAATADLKIMVWNIAGGSADITTVANYIKSVNADIIGLNEVYESQISTIMNTLGSSYQRTFHNTKINADFGNLTISKKTIDGTATQRWIYTKSSHGIAPNECTNGGDNGNRQGLMKTKISIGSGKYLFFYNTHFGRECQASTVQDPQIAEFKTWSNTHGGRKIVVGDFNFQPSSSQHSSITTGGPGFVDPLGSAYSFKTWKVGSSSLNKRLDYIMGNSWITINSISTGSSTASDHYPVIAEVSITL